MSLKKSFRLKPSFKNFEEIKSQITRTGSIKNAKKEVELIGLLNCQADLFDIRWVRFKISSNVAKPEYQVQNHWYSWSKISTQ